MKEKVVAEKHLKGHVVKMYKMDNLYRVEVDGENYPGTFEDACMEVSIGAWKNKK
jgi:hypothetical protein